MQIVQELSNCDFISRMEFCNEFVDLVNEDSGIIRHLIMSDEAHFKLSGSVNKHYMRYWSDQDNLELHMKPFHRK